MTEPREENNEPPVWDLSKIIPEFKGLTPETLQPVFDTWCDDFLNQTQALRQQLDVVTSAKWPKARNIQPLLTEFNNLGKRLQRLNTFFLLFNDEYYSDPSNLKLTTHVEERSAFLEHQLNDVWSASHLSIAAVNRLILNKISPAWKECLLRKDLPGEYIPVEEKRAQQASENPLQVDCAALYRKLTTKKYNSLEEASQDATQLINAKLHQEWESAKSQNSTPLQIAAHESGLDPDVFKAIVRSGPHTREHVQALTSVDCNQSRAFSNALNVDPEIGWDDVRDSVVSSFFAFDKRYGTWVTEKIDGGSVHAQETPYKNSFREGYYLSPPLTLDPEVGSYAFVHFREDVNDILTLGHETGHLVHRELEAPSGSRNLSRALAEFAAHFGEKIALDGLRAKSNLPLNPPADAGALDMLLYIISGDSLNFETALHEAFAKNDFAPLTPDQIATLYRDNTNNMHQKNLPTEQIVCNVGTNTMLMQNAPFYSAAYQLAELGSWALHEKYTALETDEERQKFADRWVKVLSNSSDYSYASALAKMGVDISSAEAIIAPSLRQAEKLIQLIESDLEAVYTDARQQLEACERDTTGHAEKVMRERLKERETKKER